MKNPLTMSLPVSAQPKANKDLLAFVSRLEAKMEGRLHAKEDTFTLAYVIAEKIRRMLAKLPVNGAPPEDYDEGLDFQLSYEAAAALMYELKTYPSRPKSGVLIQILNGLDAGLKEKKQHDRDHKRTAKRRDRPTVRESRGL